MSMFESLRGLNIGGDGEPGDLMPFLQNMMESLLSKEMLQPAMSSLLEKVGTIIIHR